MGGIAHVPGRGRKPKPTARKIAAGNPGKRALNTDEPNFGLITNIDPPDWITGYARDKWMEIVPLLCAQKVLQLTDITCLERYCVAYRNWRTADEDMLKNGPTVTGANGGPIKNPAATVLKESFDQMRSLETVLGLDPSSRSRLTGGGSKKQENPFGEVLNG